VRKRRETSEKRSHILKKKDVVKLAGDRRSRLEGMEERKKAYRGGIIAGIVLRQADGGGILGFFLDSDV